jgi:hypothetical protein
MDLFETMALTRTVVERQHQAEGAPLLAALLDEPPTHLWWPGATDGWGGLGEPWRARPGWPLSERLARHQADWLYATRPGEIQITRGRTEHRLTRRLQEDGQYRGCCWHCGWVGEVVNDELEAVGQALDHAHEGWRELPLVRKPASVVNAGYDSQSMAMDEWAHRLERVLPTGWLAAGGPIRTIRGQEWRPRAIRAGAPGGGWDMPGRVEARRGGGAPVALVYVASKDPWTDEGWALNDDGEIESVSAIRRRRHEAELKRRRDAEEAELLARLARNRELLARAEAALAELDPADEGYARLTDSIARLRASIADDVGDDDAYGEDAYEEDEDAWEDEGA